MPDIFYIGVIVPVPKKPSLNPNVANNYRPITVSCTFAKMLEIILLPADQVSDSQFGFRKKRGTAFGCTLFNDLKCYFEHKKSPLFTCSLDAEKCFDSIWHKALFHKLYGKIPDNSWLLLYRWYANLKACVKWRGTIGRLFRVSKGTRQGSVLSPQLFNIFIDDLLTELSNSKDRASLGPYSFNVFAYADDITCFCTTAPGLQRLINICENYAKLWRFKFGVPKTKCMIVSGQSLTEQPVWCLNDIHIANTSTMETLGVKFSSDQSRSSTAAVDGRIESCRRSFYGLRDVGMAYPGLATEVKTYIWNSMCQPILLYGMNCINLNRNSLKKLETTQCNLLKQSLGFGKYSRSSDLLQALHVTKIDRSVKIQSIKLLNQIYQVNSPIQDLCSHLISLYAYDGTVIPGTLVSRIINYGLSPVLCCFNRLKVCNDLAQSGTVDSLKHLLMHENFIKPYSEEHIISALLLRSF